MNSLDPKITTAIYFGGAFVFLCVLALIFFYTRNLKTRRATQELKGRAPVSREEGILLATEKNNDAVRTSDDPK